MKWFAVVLLVTGAVAYDENSYQGQRSYPPNSQGYAPPSHRNQKYVNSDSSNSEEYVRGPYHFQRNAEEVDLFGDQHYSTLGATRGLVANRASPHPYYVASEATSGQDAYSVSDVMLGPPVFAFFAGGSSPDHKYKFEEATEILKNSKFDKSKTTVIYIHGFLEGLFADSVKTVVETYTQMKDHNIIILDWHTGAMPEYFLSAVPNVYKIGEKAAQAILDMINSGLSVNKLHIVGHSLGGQMAGVIGRTVQKLSKGSVVLKRISTLDPAFPGFYGLPGVEHLTANDAEYVDVLHTDKGVYGAPVPTGTVDFWPNGGLHPQPGCIVNVCSHQRSWVYWTESLNAGNKNQFNAIAANSWNDFKNNVVGDYDPKAVMGYYTPWGLTGSYYLCTNKKDPFALGSEGLTYK